MLSRNYKTLSFLSFKVAQLEVYLVNHNAINS